MSSVLRPRRIALTALLCALCLPSAPLAAASGQRAVPAGFVGVNIDGPIYPTPAAGVDLTQQLRAMVAAGVETLRVNFSWAAAQPYATWAKVPASKKSQFTDVGGVPTDFAPTDAIVRAAAGYGLTVLPTIVYTPAWDAGKRVANSYGEPKRDAPFAGFVSALVHRYGPQGSFWTAGQPKLAIRQWEIWNEPDLRVYWPTQPFARSYVALLAAAHSAIKHADPRATVILGGLTNYSWEDLASIYRIKGARADFDEVAVHPFTAKPAGVITILKYVRKVMDENGDAGKPMTADEISWTSSQGQTNQKLGLDIATTEQGQANNIAGLLPTLARDRGTLRLSSFYWYTWAGLETHNGLAFGFAGLLKYSGDTLTDKPALFSFARAALAMEQCRVKGPLADQCEKKS